MGWGRPAPLRCELNLLGRSYGACWMNKASLKINEMQSCQSKCSRGFVFGGRRMRCPSINIELAYASSNNIEPAYSVSVMYIELAYSTSDN